MKIEVAELVRARAHDVKRTEESREKRKDRESVRDGSSENEETSADERRTPSTDGECGDRLRQERKHL